MLITRHQVDEEGNIYIQNVVRLLTMGIKDNVVTIWAVTDPLTDTGIPMSFFVRVDDESVDLSEGKYITSFINEDGTWHLFSQPPKIVPTSSSITNGKPN